MIRQTMRARLVAWVLVGCVFAACDPAGSALAQDQSGSVTVPAAGNPNLAVASVKLENGVRTSKIIGASVYSDPNTTVGSIDDLIMTPDHKIVMAILSVGGFVGLGSKLVAVPFEQLQPAQDGKMMLPGVTKEQINGMPNFVY